MFQKCALLQYVCTVLHLPFSKLEVGPCLFEIIFHCGIDSISCQSVELRFFVSKQFVYVDSDMMSVNWNLCVGSLNFFELKKMAKKGHHHLCT